MQTALPAISISKLLAAPTKFLTWWRNELAALVPSWLRRSLFEKRPILTVHMLDKEIRIVRHLAGKADEILSVGAEEIASGIPPDMLARIRPTLTRSRRVDVLLPYAKALRREVRLPLAAGRNVRQMLEYELQRHSPVDRSQAYFDYKIQLPGKDARDLLVRLRIVKRAEVHRAVEICGFVGLQPSTIDFLDDGIGADGGDIPLNTERKQRARSRRLMSIFLVILCAFLGLGVTFAADTRQTLLMNALDEQLAGAKAEASSVEDLRQSVKTTRGQLSFLARQKQRPLTIALLGQVTRALPDTAWIFEFQTDGKEVHLKGFAQGASLVLEKLAGERNFTNVRFRAPTISGLRRDLERFDVSFEIAEDSQ